jgi:hypothetical protein
MRGNPYNRRAGVDSNHPKLQQLNADCAAVPAKKLNMLAARLYKSRSTYLNFLAGTAADCGEY